MPEKYQQDLTEAIRNLQIADHMTYITLPLINDKRLFLKIFDNIYKSIMACINAILNFEYKYKRVTFYTDPDENMQTFLNQCSRDYGLDKTHVNKIKEMIAINKQHKQSAMEFVKKDKIIILSDNLGTQILDLQKIKEFLLLAKELLMKTNNKIKLSTPQ